MAKSKRPPQDKGEYVDLRYPRDWGVEDSTTGVAGIVYGNIVKARREAFKLCEYRHAPVMIYRITDAREWIAEELVTP